MYSYASLGVCIALGSPIGEQHSNALTWGIQFATPSLQIDFEDV